MAQPQAHQDPGNHRRQQAVPTEHKFQDPLLLGIPGLRRHDSTRLGRSPAADLIPVLAKLRTAMINTS